VGAAGRRGQAEVPSYKYVIVGGGMTGDAAVKGIREVDSDGSIALIGSEPERPYKRPPLTKDLWKGMPLEKIWLETPEDGVEFLLERTVESVDVSNKRVLDDRGTEYEFEKLLVATGGTPRTLTLQGNGAGEVIYYRTFDDYQRLREMAGTRERFAVIGAGFIGSEIGAALAMNGREVIMIFPGTAIGENVYPPGLARFLNQYYREKGVTIMSGCTAVGVEKRDGRLVLAARGKDGGEKEVEVDGVVAGIGIEPNVDLAREAGLDLDDGIVVDEQLRAGHPDVFAAGDVASFHNPSLGTRIRVEHEDNAKAMGKAAGRNMAGAGEPYHHLPFFYSDLFDLGYEAVGELDSRLETVEDWTEEYHKGVVYYLRDGRVRGVLLWNVWEQVEAARRLIAERGPIAPADLEGRLPGSK
jgi:3-phenylpropionate/trans-cinnamate dioxygenase ferredoxin reductase subunit